LRYSVVQKIVLINKSFYKAFFAIIDDGINKLRDEHLVKENKGKRVI
jgi:hypothetical protein